ncbi:MAG: NAD(+) synthase [Deltaproteobacteria bacterium]|nr:NAD(+) synthase [Deltaproteobacteria bacterium]
MTTSFDSIYTHHFLRVAVCIPSVRVANPRYNATRILALARRASQENAAVALFPELCVSAYSNEDLFQQDALLNATLDALRQLVESSSDLTPLLIVGAPLRYENKLFNCAVTFYKGRVLGITPKTYLPNYREFYEKRQFSSGSHAAFRDVAILNQSVPFGNDLIYEAANVEGFAAHAEICEDIWVPIPPSTYAALAGATVLTNLSASNIIIGKADYRRLLCSSQSGRCVAAYLYAAAGPGESTTDLAWDGHGLVYENSELLAESQRFASEEQMVLADIDLDRLIQERSRMTTFNDLAAEYREKIKPMRRIRFEFKIPHDSLPLKRALNRFPYVPIDPAARDRRCSEAYNIQVHGLAKRLQATCIEKVIIGVSGGLDSTHALIVAAKTMDRLKLPRANVLAYTMPGFATSELTRANALKLMGALEVTGSEIDIRPSCLQMLKDLHHPFAEGRPVYDITFENIQAGERTSHLFRLANYHNGLVVGTGDLSELALGWCTYGVGDQMSHYNVNASVPKTLIQYLIQWVISSRQFDETANKTLESVLETEISPELIPGTDEAACQATESVIGPYALQDFNLYYLSRFGLRPSKVAYLAHQAWRDKNHGAWPDSVPVNQRREYSLAEIKHWLEVFLIRFFQTSQFKRSCLPNAPKVGSGGSLSPRGDWRAPSDAEAEAWLHELRTRVPDL